MKRRDLLKLLGLGAATAVVKPDAALPAASETTVESIPLRAGGMRYVGYGGGFTAPFVETYEDFVREALLKYPPGRSLRPPCDDEESMFAATP
jgi:hypothetical protein